MKIYDKLQDVLSAEDLESFKAEVAKTISEAVEIKNEELTKEFEANLKEATEFLEKTSEEYVELKISEERSAILEQYESKMQKFEEETVEKLSDFIDYQINENISDELLEKVALNETYAPIVEGIRSLFEDRFVALDSDGKRFIEEAKTAKELAETQLSEEIQKNIELNTLAEQAATELLVREKIDESDLSLLESKKLRAFFEGKAFDEVSEKIDTYIGLLKEETEEVPAGSQTLQEAYSDEGDGVADKKIVLNESVATEDSFTKLVNRYL